MHFGDHFELFREHISYKKVFEQYSKVSCIQKCIFQYQNLDSIAFKKEITIISRLYPFWLPS